MGELDGMSSAELWPVKASKRQMANRAKYVPGEVGVGRQSKAESTGSVRVS